MKEGMGATMKNVKMRKNVMNLEAEKETGVENSTMTFGATIDGKMNITKMSLEKDGILKIWNLTFTIQILLKLN